MKTWTIFIFIVFFGANAIAQNDSFYLIQKLSSWCKVIEDNVDMNSISISPDEKFIASATTMSSLKIWDIEKGIIKFLIEDNPEVKSFFTRGLIYSPNGMYLATVGSSSSKANDNSSGKYINCKTIRVYETKNYKLLKEINWDTTGEVLSCAFSPKSDYFITGETQIAPQNSSTIRSYKISDWSLKSKTDVNAIPWTMQ